VTTLSVGSPTIRRVVLGMGNVDFYPLDSVRLSLGPSQPLSDIPVSTVNALFTLEQIMKAQTGDRGISILFL